MTTPREDARVDAEVATDPRREARDVLLRALQDARVYSRERQRIEDAADGMVRAALAAEADRGTCGNCHHDPDAHSPVNRETCAMPGCDCPGLLTPGSRR